MPQNLLKRELKCQAAILQNFSVCKLQFYAVKLVRLRINFFKPSLMYGFKVEHRSNLYGGLYYKTFYGRNLQIW
jgi:hypothetical protein